MITPESLHRLAALTEELELLRLEIESAMDGEPVGKSQVNLKAHEQIQLRWKGTITALRNLHTALVQHEQG